MPITDARYVQIAFLGLLFAAGLVQRDFGISPVQIALCFGSAFTTQALCLHILGQPQRRQIAGYLSACVSSFGICILVRSDLWWLHGVLASLAMASKFALRAGTGPQRSHIFNPANLAAAVAALGSLDGVALPFFTDLYLHIRTHAWLSPAQWGSQTLFALWILGLGGMVCRRIGRLDISLVFLLTWGGLMAARLLHLGYIQNDPDLAWRMWRHSMSGGGLLLFAFFMISDPMTTPNSRAMRIGYAVIVALAAHLWQYQLYRPHGLVLALFALSPLVPLLNWFGRAPRFAWDSRQPNKSAPTIEPA